MGETPGGRLVTAEGDVITVRQAVAGAVLTFHPGNGVVYFTSALGAVDANTVADWLRECVTPAEPDEAPAAPDRPTAAEVVALFLTGKVDEAGRKLFDLDEVEVLRLDGMLSELSQLVQGVRRVKGGHSARLTSDQLVKWFTPNRGEAAQR